MSQHNLRLQVPSPSQPAEGPLPFFISSATPAAATSKNRFRVFRGWKTIIFNSWLNALLCFVPIASLLSRREKDYNAIVFLCCFLALIPLVKLHELTTRELAIRFGGSKTCLVLFSMGNIVEVVVAVSALHKCELRIVQSSLMGSMLSKLLLVLGLCFFAGGLRFTEQTYDPTSNQINSPLLTISVGVLILPAAYHLSIGGGADVISDLQKHTILRMSRGVSIILILIYSLYLVFQLFSHSHLYQDHRARSNKNRFSKINPFHKHSPPKISLATSSSDELGKCLPSAESQNLPISSERTGYPPTPLVRCWNPGTVSSNSYASVSEVTLAPLDNSTVRLVPAGGGVPMNRHSTSDSYSGSNSTSSLDSTEMMLSQPELKGFDSETNSFKIPATPQSERSDMFAAKDPELSLTLTILLLVGVTVAVAFVADELVESMDSIPIRKEWVALILLPAVSCIAECVTAISVSVRDQLTLSISVAVGSTIQTALFVIPLMVILSWSMGRPLTLLFDPFESMIFFIAVQTMTHVVASGHSKSNWFEGIILLGLYSVISVSFWYYPGSHLSLSLATCPINASD
ncbi:hypothetical protein C8J56DRAFT_1162091 [Mycena floridula]|nr:hypothetical protein C8J56DRAFT_1162091 [Mycena floridula]